MKFLKTFENYSVNEEIFGIGNQVEQAIGERLSYYLSNPNDSECPVLDFLMKHQVEKVDGKVEVESDPNITINKKEKKWILSYFFFVTDSEIGKWFAKATEKSINKYPGHQYKIELILPADELDFTISLYKSKRIKQDQLLKELEKLSNNSGGYGFKITDMKVSQMNYVRKTNPEALKDIGLYNMKGFELDDSALRDIDWSK